MGGRIVPISFPAETRLHTEVSLLVTDHQADFAYDRIFLAVCTRTADILLMLDDSGMFAAVFPH